MNAIFFYLCVVSSAPSPVGGENGAVHVVPWGTFSTDVPWARGGAAGGQVDQAGGAGNRRGPRANPQRPIGDRGRRSDRLGPLRLL